MKTLFNTLSDLLAEAALREEGVPAGSSAAACTSYPETIEENLVEVAFAEAADYEDIHLAIQREHLTRCVAA